MKEGRAPRCTRLQEDIFLKHGIENYPHYDQVGSLRTITDTTGNVVKQIDYDSFGNIITDTNTTMTVPFGFAGGLHDQDTGLVRFGFRDYDPAVGRWTAKDPIDFAGGDVNLYAYARIDPVNFVDLLGLDSLRVDPLITYWLDDAGMVVDTYASISGPFGKGPLPPGNYTGDNLRRRTRQGMVCDGVGWSLDLTPSDFSTDRDLLRIHPDQSPTGTLGCIGIACDDASRFYMDLRNYFQQGNSSISVEVW